MAKNIKAVKNPLARQPLIQTRGTGNNAAHVPTARGATAVRNPLARQKN